MRIAGGRIGELLHFFINLYRFRSSLFNLFLQISFTLQNSFFILLVCPDLKLSVALNGEDLIKLLKKVERPDAIVLDLNMPCKDGKQCLLEIRDNAHFNDVPVVILSTSSSRLGIDYSLINGANNYIIKPQSFEGMKSIVESLCNRQLGMTA